MTVTSFEWSINCSSYWTTSVWEFTSLLFVWLVKCVCSAISCWLSATTYGCVISAGSIAVSAVTSGKVADVHSGIHSVDIGKVSWTSLDRSLSVMIDIHSSIHILIITITLNWHAVLMLDWVACSTVLSLLAKFSLGNCLYVRVVSIGVILSCWVHAWYHLVVVGCWIEELLGRHHHLLIVVLITVWSFPLINQIEQMSLVILGNTVSCTDSVISNTAWVDTKWACAISITCVAILMMILIEWLASMMLLCLEIIHILLSSVALSDVFHEVAIVHGVSHLCLVLVTTFAWVLRITKTTNSSLIEHLLLVNLTIDMWEHLMNPWIIGWLE